MCICGLVTYKPVSDLEADYSQQQEGREEGIEEKKVKCVSGQSTRIALINDLVAFSDHTGPWQRYGNIACEVQLVEFSDNEQLTAVLLEGQVAEPLEDLGHLRVASEEARTH